MVPLYQRVIDIESAVGLTLRHEKSSGCIAYRLDSDCGARRILVRYLTLLLEAT